MGWRADLKKWLFNRINDKCWLLFQGRSASVSRILRRRRRRPFCSRWTIRNWNSWMFVSCFGHFRLMIPELNCQQSLFFFRFSEGSVCVRDVRDHLRVRRVFLDGLRKKRDRSQSIPEYQNSFQGSPLSSSLAMFTIFIWELIIYLTCNHSSRYISPSSKLLKFLRMNGNRNRWRVSVSIQGHISIYYKKMLILNPLNDNIYQNKNSHLLPYLFDFPIEVLGRICFMYQELQAWPIIKC